MKMSSIAKCALLIAAVAGAAGTLAAQNSVITFSVDMSVQIGNATFTPGTDTVWVQGTFNNWSPLIQLFQVGSSTVYTNTATDTLEANGSVTKYQYVIDQNNYEVSADSNLRAAVLPATSGGSLVLPTPFWHDAGPPITDNITFQVDMSQQINLSSFTPGTSTVEVQGNFNGWTASASILTNDPTILRTNQFGLVTSNVYVGTFASSASSNAAMDYKFVIEPGHYEGVSAANGDNGGNRFYVENTDQVRPVVNYSDQPYAPLGQVTFNVDMSAVLISDPTFNPATVVIDGDFNSWAADVPCTNNAAASNTNIYSATITIGEGAAVNYQFRYQDSGGTVYDHPASNPGGNRFFQVPVQASVNVPAVFFNDISTNDLLNVDTTVLFSVNMTNAQSYSTGTPFNPSSDNVYINGDFLGWLNWDPISLASEQMTNNPVGSEVYSFSYTFPKGHAREVTYKYSIDGNDNEAGFGQNHFRYIRSTSGVENLALDKFGTQTVEQKYGNLAIGQPSGGSFPLTWLGYPGVVLQSRANLSSGSWQTVPGTSGQNSANWSSGAPSQFFRLNQP
jgi:hypothetical protein